ncbi:sporulation peptidase YabG [Hydrogenibacillus sp. N12]|uniref:sporulation peptidase YabG n=1 Tax=Hydrogenibacillus sp. N12 TaxID=2866627 RepID=UPI001C7DA211|nr:sporulation peptidase YabG [Hydrogenibacillus sp. N12]QZA33061.1 sporulation peptidase YabG [Hydrogenibacillus sp. N12]
MITVGMLVGRKSYGRDIVFRVIQIDHAARVALLQGKDVRLLADAPLDDLEPVDDAEGEADDGASGKTSRPAPPPPAPRGRTLGTRAVPYPGKVLHLDGDARYLALSMAEYERLGLPAVGLNLPEREMPKKVSTLLRRTQPDILVLTGHDAYQRGRDIYRHSRYFIDAVRHAREVERHKDALIIVAGACQSDYDGLMAAGANFASSPARMNIHALDPVRVVSRLATASVRDIVAPDAAIADVTGGARGFGGIETRGTLRLGFPENAR